MASSNIRDIPERNSRSKPQGGPRKLCNMFDTPNGCPHGDRCHFEHPSTVKRTQHNDIPATVEGAFAAVDRWASQKEVCQMYGKSCKYGAKCTHNLQKTTGPATSISKPQTVEPASQVCSVCGKGFAEHTTDGKSTGWCPRKFAGKPKKSSHQAKSDAVDAEIAKVELVLKQQHLEMKMMMMETNRIALEALKKKA